MASSGYLALALLFIVRVQSASVNQFNAQVDVIRDGVREPSIAQPHTDALPLPLVKAGYVGGMPVSSISRFPGNTPPNALNDYLAAKQGRVAPAAPGGRRRNRPRPIKTQNSLIPIDPRYDPRINQSQIDDHSQSLFFHVPTGMGDEDARALATEIVETSHARAQRDAHYLFRLMYQSFIDTHGRSPRNKEELFGIASMPSDHVLTSAYDKATSSLQQDLIALASATNYDPQSSAQLFTVHPHAGAIQQHLSNDASPGTSATAASANATRKNDDDDIDVNKKDDHIFNILKDFEGYARGLKKDEGTHRPPEPSSPWFSEFSQLIGGNVASPYTGTTQPPEEAMQSAPLFQTTPQFSAPPMLSSGKPTHRRRKKTTQRRSGS